ncbi:MAG TPA: ABC transporter substrate-binding protein [Conexibacter sp.]|jgi:peptide/nickel transport system substrate-binding protein|nr:ABC transporter substrate-binding protein [Conexibacter sp.]
MSRREVLQRLGVGGAMLTLPGLLAACGARDASTGGMARGAGTDAEIESVTWTVGAAPPTLDIATDLVSSGLLVMALGLEGLLMSDDELALRPRLAQSWAQPDPLRYVFKLRAGVKFWDGTPLTVHDVAYSLRRHIDPKVSSQLGSYYANVKSIDVTGADEVTVRMTKPDPIFQYALVFSYVTPMAFSERLGKNLGVAGPKVSTMGTGPFRITAFSPDTGVTLKRNPLYWGERPRVRNASLKFIADPETQLLAMKSGEIDGVFAFSPRQSKLWDHTRGIGTQYSPGMTVVYLTFDVTAAPWDDIHVRRAIAYAADRAGYVKAFIGGHGRPAEAVVAREQWRGLVSPAEVDAIYAQIPQYPFDLTKAKAELAQSAHPNGFTTSIDFPNTDPEIGEALVSLSQTLKTLGITLHVNEVTQTAWLAGLAAHKNLGMHLMSLGPDYADPANYPALIYPSANAVANNFNLANFKDATVDRLLKEQAGTRDKGARARALGEVLRISGEQLPYLPLWFVDDSLALSDRFVYEGFNGLYYYQNWLGHLRVRA